VFLLGGILAGCGESGQGIRDNGQCPEQQPFYRYIDGGGGNGLAAWAARRRHLDGTPFTPAEEQALQQTIGTATSDTPQGGRCLTPAGHALSIDAGTK
jgi:hypothetical protein